MSNWLQSQFRAAEGLLEAVDRTAKHVSKKELLDEQNRLGVSVEGKSAGMSNPSSGNFFWKGHYLRLGNRPSRDVSQFERRIDSEAMITCAASGAAAPRQAQESPQRTVPRQVLN